MATDGDKTDVVPTQPRELTFPVQETNIHQTLLQHLPKEREAVKKKMQETADFMAKLSDYLDYLNDVAKGGRIPD